jgi:hypothetical protein
MRKRKTRFGRPENSGVPSRVFGCKKETTSSASGQKKLIAMDKIKTP